LAALEILFFRLAHPKQHYPLNLTFSLPVIGENDRGRDLSQHFENFTLIPGTFTAVNFSGKLK